MRTMQGGMVEVVGVDASGVEREWDCFKDKEGKLLHRKAVSVCKMHESNFLSEQNLKIPAYTYP